jgi:NAD(P) transhydrogenase subunit alpha
MDPHQLAEQAARIADQAQSLAAQAAAFANHALPGGEVMAHPVSPFLFLLAVFLMACFVGYYVVWNVTPALHSPLMGVTNAISSVIIVGAMLSAGLATSVWAQAFGFIGVTLASVNIFGGFTVTQRMLAMFKAKK